MKKSNLKQMVMMGMVILLSGCIKIIPVSVVQRIVIERNGTMTMDYQGKFRGLHELAMAKAENQGRVLTQPDIEKSQATEDKAAYEAAKTAADLKSFTKEADGLFAIHWQSPGAIFKIAGESPTVFVLATANEEDYHEAAGKKSPETFTIYDGMANAREGINQAIQSGGEDGQTRGLNSLLKKYVQAFHGRLEIEINPEFVTGINGQAPDKAMMATLKDGQDGRKILVYDFAGITPPPSNKLLEFSFADQQSNAFKLAHAEPGTSCQALIGANCKCGPIKLTQGEGVLAHQPVAEIVNGKTYQRCSDENGNVEAVETTVTGDCIIRPVGGKNAWSCPSTP